MKNDYYTNPEMQKGGQPVKVLRENIDKWFKNVYPEFGTTELKEAIEKFQLHDELNVIEREDKIASPPLVQASSLYPLFIERLARATIKPQSFLFH